MKNSYKLALASGVSAIVAFTGPSAYATPAAFGPAVANADLSFSVKVSVPSGGQQTINLTGNSDYILGVNSSTTTATGTLKSAPFGAKNTSSTAGTLKFSTSQGATISDPVTGMFTFQDGAGGTYDFDLSSVSTTQYLYNPGTTVQIGLYLLGTMYDNNASNTFTPTNTSITFTINATGSNTNYSPGLSLANPPSPNPVPEPAALSLLGTGLVGLGAMRRRRR